MMAFLIAVCIIYMWALRRDNKILESRITELNNQDGLIESLRLELRAETDYNLALHSILKTYETKLGAEKCVELLDGLSIDKTLEDIEKKIRDDNQQE